MTRRFALKLVAAAGLVLTGCASSPPPAPAVVEGKDTGFDQRAYVLGPTDKLRVIVFGEPNLSNEFVIDSKPGEGTTFTVWLPEAKPEDRREQS